MKTISFYLKLGAKRNILCGFPLEMHTLVLPYVGNNLGIQRIQDLHAQKVKKETFESFMNLLNV